MSLKIININGQESYLFLIFDEDGFHKLVSVPTNDPIIEEIDKKSEHGWHGEVTLTKELKNRLECDFDDIEYEAIMSDTIDDCDEETEEEEEE